MLNINESSMANEQKIEDALKEVQFSRKQAIFFIYKRWGNTLGIKLSIFKWILTQDQCGLLNILESSKEYPDW